MNLEQCYLQDVLAKLVEDAIQAKILTIVDRPNRAPEEMAFAQGRALAYYEVVSTLLNQANAFGLSHDALPVLDFDVDKELL